MALDKENRVRDAAKELYEAIKEAVASGLRVDWPHTHEALPEIAVSETGKMQKPVTAAGKPYDAPRPLPDEAAVKK